MNSITLIFQSFIFSITKPFSHIGRFLLGLLVNLAAYILVFLCFLVPAFGIMSVYNLYVIGYKTNIIPNSMLGSVGLASSLAMIWRFTGLVRFYDLMYDKKPLVNNVFFVPVRLFARAYLAFPFILALLFIISPPQPAAMIPMLAKLSSMFGSSFIPMLLLSIVGIGILLYWAAVGQFILLEIAKGTTINKAIPRGFHLVHRNLFTTMLYEMKIVGIAVVLFYLLFRFSLSLAFWPLMAISIASNCFILVIFPASLVYLYKQLRAPATSA